MGLAHWRRSLGDSGSALMTTTAVSGARSAVDFIEESLRVSASLRHATRAGTVLPVLR